MAFQNDKTRVLTLTLTSHVLEARSIFELNSGDIDCFNYFTHNALIDSVNSIVPFRLFVKIEHVLKHAGLYIYIFVQCKSNNLFLTTVMFYRCVESTKQRQTRQMVSFVLLLYCCGSCVGGAVLTVIKAVWGDDSALISIALPMGPVVLIAGVSRFLNESIRRLLVVYRLLMDFSVEANWIQNSDGADSDVLVEHDRFGG